MASRGFSILLLLPVVALGQTTNTNCYRVGESVHCQSYSTQSPSSAPNFADSFLKGAAVGASISESRARQEQIELQNQMLRMQMAEQRDLAQQREEAARRAEADLRQRQTDEKERMGAFWRQQVDACVRIEQAQPDRPAESCVDQLLVTDAHFARAYAIAGGGPQTQQRIVQGREDQRRADAKMRSMSEKLATIEGCTPAQLRSGSCASQVEAAGSAEPR